MFFTILQTSNLAMLPLTCYFRSITSVGTPIFRPLTICSLTIRPLSIRPHHPHSRPHPHTYPHPQIKLGRVVRGRNEQGRNEWSPLQDPID
jgi:hypothetical protein